MSDYEIGYHVKVDVKGAQQIADNLGDGLALIADLTKVIRKWTYAAQHRATQNVSGNQVVYSKGTFIINRQTGTLARRFRVYFPNAFTGVLENTADYAAAIEEGHKQIDMKPYLMGKVIPLRLSTAQGKAVQAGALTLFVGRLNKQVSVSGFKATPLKASTGKSAGNSYILFRRVGPNSKGWIIPAAKPRPFMGAAREYIEPLFRADVERVLTEHFSNSATP